MRLFTRTPSLHQHLHSVVSLLLVRHDGSARFLSFKARGGVFFPSPAFCSPTFCCFVMPKGRSRPFHDHSVPKPSHPWHTHLLKPRSKERVASSLRPKPNLISPSPPSFLPPSLPPPARHHGQQQLHLPGDRHREASHRCRHQGGVRECFGPVQEESR